MQTPLLAVMGISISVLAVWIVVVLRHVVLVPPTRIGVLAGRRGPDGRGYRIVSGRVVRIPMIESFELMPLAPEVVHANIKHAYFARGESGPISATIAVRWARGDDLHNAVERFLGRDTSAVATVVSETAEGALRLLATNLTRAELREVDKASEALSNALEHDLRKLGLDLESAHVHDHASGDAGDPLEARLRDAGILDIEIATELSCDVVSDGQTPSSDELDTAGSPRVSVASGRMRLRWASTRVPEAQLVAGARLLVAARTSKRTYR